METPVPSRRQVHFLDGESTMRFLQNGWTIAPLAVLGVSLLALAPAARAQSTDETVLFLLSGETQAPKKDGRYGTDSRWEDAIALGNFGDGNTPVVFHAHWRLQPLDACRYRRFILRYTTRLDGSVLTEDNTRPIASAAWPMYTMSEFDFRKLVTAKASRFGLGFSTQFTFTEFFEAQARLDPAAVSGGRMVAFDAREFPSPSPRTVLIAGGSGTAGFETRFTDAVKYLRDKLCPKASAF